MFQTKHGVLRHLVDNKELHQLTLSRFVCYEKERTKATIPLLSAKPCTIKLVLGQQAMTSIFYVVKINLQVN